MTINEERLLPLNGNIIVQVHSEEKTTEGGLVIPGTVSETIKCGIVRAISAGRVLDNGDFVSHALSVDDKVYYRPDHAIPIGRTFCVMDERAVVAVKNNVDVGAMVDV